MSDCLASLTLNFNAVVCFLGTLSWLDKLNWIGAPLWHNTSQEALEINMINEGYVRRAGNLIFYIILRAGHSVRICGLRVRVQIFKGSLLQFQFTGPGG